MWIALSFEESLTDCGASNTLKIAYNQNCIVTWHICPYGTTNKPWGRGKNKQYCNEIKWELLPFSKPFPAIKRNILLLATGAQKMLCPPSHPCHSDFYVDISTHLSFCHKISHAYVQQLIIYSLWAHHIHIDLWSHLSLKCPDSFRQVIYYRVLKVIKSQAIEFTQWARPCFTCQN